MITICFTGHRPSKLGGYDWNSSKNQAIMKELRRQIIEIINSSEGNEFHFIFGGAIGIDQMAYDIVDNIKRNTLKLNPVTIYMEVAIPFLKQDTKWNFEDGLRWRQQLSMADKITEVDKLEDYKIKGYEERIYYPAKMQKRNEYMVDNADIVIAVWDGSKGGTGNCVKYAERLGRRIIIINPKDIE